MMVEWSFSYWLEQLIYADFGFWTVNNMLYFSSFLASAEGVTEDRYIFIYV